MRQWISQSILAVMVVGLASPGWSQSGGRDSNARSNVREYEDISQRRTRSTEREDRKKQEAEEARKKAEEEKRREERRQRYEAANNRGGENRGADDKNQQTQGDRRQTTGTRNAGGAPGAPRTQGAKLPGTAGGSTDPTSQEVNEVILNAVQTRTVQFDVEREKSNPDLILLNEPKFELKNRQRAGDTGRAESL